MKLELEFMSERIIIVPFYRFNDTEHLDIFRLSRMDL